MITIPAILQAHHEQEVTTLAQLWLLTRKDSTEFAFTTHDQNITYGGKTYEAAGGFEPTAISMNRLISVDNLDVKGFLSDAKIKELDVHAGVYDGAQVDIVVVNYNNLTTGQHYILAVGWTIGNINVNDNSFTMEARSKKQKLQQTVGKVYSPECRAVLGDSECTKVLFPTFTRFGLIDTVTSQSVFTTKDLYIFPSTPDTPATDVFAYGTCNFSGGANDGLAMEIKSWNPSTHELVLVDAMIYPLEVDDVFLLLFGCDKRETTCKTTFDNFINFRGEPDIPGFDKMMQYPDRE